jgi:two-component system sensor histidine kinase ComP
VPAAGVTAALLPFVIFYGLPALLLKQEVITWQWTMPFLSLIPLTWFYLSVSDRFIDVSFVTGRLVYCGTIGAGAAVLVSGVFSMMAQNGSAYGSMDWIRLAFAVWTIVTMTLYLKEFLDYSLRKRLYPKRQDYQTSLNRFLQWMKMDPDTSGLGKILKKEIEACLPFENVRLIREGLTGEKSPVIDGNRVSLFTEPDRKIAFSKKGFSALLSAGHSEDITLAGSWSGPRTRLNPDERSWLATLISYAQIATENLKNTKELLAELRQPVREGRALPITVKKMMVRISEQERKELAKDLHDHNLQDQLAFARDMDSWREWTQDRKLGHFLGYIREQVLDSVYILRQVIYEIHPEFIYRAGLKKSLDELFEKVNLRGDFVLETFIDDRTAMLPKEFEMTVYRVVQELLNNAMKHAGAKRVTLRLSKEGNEFGLYYEDDGVGMDVSKVGQSFGTMGFPGMIGRVEGIGGRIVIRSQKGKGLSVKIRWPAD